MGYAPLFDSLTKGSLCGRWPDIGLWPIVLSLSDAHGIVDVHFGFLAGVTGLPIEELTACMQRFCQPDPHSRSKEHGGARLVLLDEHRDWGWRIVNYGHYREKARKSMQQHEATSSGRDAERKRLERERQSSSDVQRCPALSGRDRPSDTDTDIGSKNTSAAARPTRNGDSRGTGIETDDWFLNFKLAFPDRAGSQPWQRARKSANARIADGHKPEDFIAGARRYAAYCAATGKANTEFVMQAATFLGPDKPFAQPWDPPETPATRDAMKRAQAERRALSELAARAERIGFRQPIDGEDAIGYRTLVERAEREQPRRGLQPIAKLLGSAP